MKKLTLSTLLLAVFATAASTSASAGCSCPSGYRTVAGASVGSGAAKVCHKSYRKTDKRNATCDLGLKFKYNVYGKKDQCKSLWGYGSTIPSGTTGIIGNPSHFGWALKKYSGRDQWWKTTKHSKLKACIG